MRKRTNAITPVPAFSQRLNLGPLAGSEPTGFSNHEVEMSLCFKAAETDVIFSVSLIPQLGVGLGETRAQRPDVTSSRSVSSEVL